MSCTNILWVLFNPPKYVVPPESLILSFLPPLEENSFQEKHKIFFGSEASSRSVRGEAIAIYHQLIAEVGIVKMPDRRTFRQSLKKKDETTPWWFHTVAFRDSEGDQILNNIIKILTIQKTVEECNAKGIILCGAESGLAEVLRSKYEVREIEPVAGGSSVGMYLYGIASRLKYLANIFRYRNALKKNYRLPSIRNYDLVFSGFWDWSFWENEKTGDLDDRYFRNLLRTLKTKGISDIGYFAWFDPDAEPDKKGRELTQVLKPLKERGDVVILQMLLKVSDAVRALLDFRPLKVYKKVIKEKEFLNAFRKSGLNWFPLFEKSLLTGFLNSHIPFCTLVAKAVERATERYAPSLSLSFLEHFPYSKAYYEGMHRSERNASCWAVQHAAYNHEKTFYYLHPNIEFRGSPDGNAVPHPDKIFVMGRLGQELFRECGYEDDQVTMSGSPRYDHIRMPLPIIVRKSQSVEKVILLVCSLSVETELPMVEAVSRALQNIAGLRLRLRNHPFARVDKQPRYKQLNLDIEVSTASLEEDLANCDLLIFSYSTVAEEAFLRGIPVWQWLPQGFNGSALSEIMDIPRFATVPSLQTALRNFLENPDLYRPTKEMMQEAAEEIFCPADGQATERIAIECLNYLKKKKQKDLI